MKTLRLLIPAIVVLLLLTGALSAQEPVVVTWWTEEGLFLDHVQNTFVAAFNEAHPDIRLELVGQQDLNNVLRTAFAAGEAPDILQTPGASFIAEFIDAGLILPLTAAAEDNGWGDKLLPWAYESGIIEGELYSIPLTYESMVLFYNKRLFEENGWTLPTSLDELETLAQTIADAGLHPFAYSNAEWQPSNEHLMGVYLNNYAGPDNVYQALIGEKAWTDEEFVGATNLLKTHLADNGWYSGSLENYYVYSGVDVWGELVAGEAAMILTGTWCFNCARENFLDDASEDWDWAPIPMFNGASADDYIYLLATGSTLSVNGQSEHPDATIEVLNFLLSDPALVLETSSGASFGEWMVPLNYTPEDFPADTDPRIVRFFSDFAQVTGQGRYGYTTWTFWPAQPNVQLWEAVESVWAGDITTEEYLAEQQALWDEARADGKTLPIPLRQ